MQGGSVQVKYHMIQPEVEWGSNRICEGGDRCVGGVHTHCEKRESEYSMHKECSIQVKAYLHSERFRLKFCREIVTLRGF